MSEAHKARRAAKRNNTTPKSVYDALKPLRTNQFNPVQKKDIPGPTLKAYCKRFANRSILIGRTHFKFDSLGRMIMKPNGRTVQQSDFKMLCKMSGVKNETVYQDVLPPAPTPVLEAPEVPVAKATPRKKKEEPKVEEPTAVPVTTTDTIAVDDTIQFTWTDATEELPTETVIEYPAVAPETDASAAPDETPVKRPRGRPKKNKENS